MPWPEPMTTRSPRSTASIRLARISRSRSARWKGSTQSERGSRREGWGMSVEIEVGLENASKVKTTVEELKLKPPQKGLANPRTKRLLFAGGLVILAAVVGLFLYYRNRESTDDAQV